MGIYEWVSAAVSYIPFKGDRDEVSAELADLGELAEPVDADVPAEVDGLELSDLSDDAACCAGVTPEKHAAALETMRSCQIAVR